MDTNFYFNCGHRSGGVCPTDTAVYLDFCDECASEPSTISGWDIDMRDAERPHVRRVGTVHIGAREIIPTSMSDRYA